VRCLGRDGIVRALIRQENGRIHDWKERSAEGALGIEERAIKRRKKLAAKTASNQSGQPNQTTAQ
jgi:hypothetical protein